VVSITVPRSTQRQSGDFLSMLRLLAKPMTDRRDPGVDVDQYTRYSPPIWTMSGAQT
jgi:hypothetical protein